MLKLRYIHRWATLLALIPALFLALTGVVIQGIDLRSILTHTPASDANVRAMNESFDGPPDFAVRTTADRLAKPLPAGADYAAMLATTFTALRSQFGPVPVDYIEFRMAGDRPVAQVGVAGGHIRFAGAQVLEQTKRDIPEDPSPASDRNIFKHLHRMTSFGDWALYINIATSLGLVTLMVTGLMVYVKLLAQRRKIKRPALFWSAGGQWRSLHRAVSLVCALFLAVATLSGGWLASDSLYRHFDVAAQAQSPHPPARPAPLTDAQLPAMLRVTFTALQYTAPGAPVQVIRLRNYGPYRQGVVVTGGEDARQLVFNAQTGARMTETEPGYPRVHFPFGWQMHQWAKSVHRGDIIGMPGRWMDLIAGFALLYLTVSGGVMYWQMWQKRRASGRTQLIWK